MNVKQKEFFERSVKHCEMILEDCTDQTLRDNAIEQLVSVLPELGRHEEAVAYARQHPRANDLLINCLTGEEGKKHRQAMLFHKITDVLLLLDRSLPALEAKEKIIQALIPDGNYLGSSASVRAIHWKLAEIAVSDGNYDTAVQELAKSKQYTLEADRCMTSPKQLYTSPLLDHYGYDYSDGRPTKPLIEYWYEEVPETFAKLADREDFRALLEGQN